MYECNTETPSSVNFNASLSASHTDLYELSGFINQFADLHKRDQDAHYESLAATLKWLNALPISTDSKENTKRVRLHAYLTGALSTRRANE